MKAAIFLIAGLILTGKGQAAHSSGCGGPSGGSISEINVLSRSHIQRKDYRVLAWAPGVVQIKHSGKLMSLVNAEGKGLADFPARAVLSLEKIRFEEYDGCEGFETRYTNRYIFQTRHGSKFEWPLLKVYESYGELYKYSQEALLTDSPGVGGASTNEVF